MVNKILIVDSDKVNIASLKFRLTEKGYEIVLANDGVEGLQKVQEVSPDLIILDMYMPSMTGYEFVSKLKSVRGSHVIPTIMLVSEDTMENVFKIEDIKGYFLKPVDFTLLLSKIKECL